MKKSKIKNLFGFAIVAFVMAWNLSSSASASLILIAGWTYETSLTSTYNVVGQNAGPHLAELGLQAGIAPSTGFHANAATVFTSPAGNGSPRSFSSNTWTSGDYYQFRVNLTGFQNSCLVWDQTRSGTGPSDFTLQLSTDGSTFNNHSTYVVNQVGWSSLGSPNPLSNFGPILLPAALDNQASVFVRLSSNGTTALGGTNRIDNVQILAQQVPEPTTFSLLGVSIVGMTLLRRRK